VDLKDAYIGQNKIARMYHGENIAFPAPVQDGLAVWYDFMGRKDSDTKRIIAEDLSGNGNHGQLTNFAFVEGSGYEKGLRFDGVDDLIRIPYRFHLSEATVEFTLNHNEGAKDGVFSRDVVPNSFIITLSNGELLRFYVNGANGTLGYYNFPVPPHGIFNHYAMSYSSVLGKLKIFINGEKVLEVDGNIGIVSQSISIPSGSGGRKYGSLRFYEKYLTDEEIAHNYAIEKERWNL